MATKAKLKTASAKPKASDKSYVRDLRKRIETYSDAELDDAVGHAVGVCECINVDFYDILRGIDAYFEKRRRKIAVKQDADHDAAMRAARQGDEWGSS